MVAFFYVFSYADRRDWLLYAVGTIAAMLTGISFPALDLLYGYWTNGITNPSRSPDDLRVLARRISLALFGIGVGQIVMSTLFLTCFIVAGSRVTARLRRAYLNSIVHQDAIFFEQVGPGEVGTRMIKDMNVIKAAVGEKMSYMVWSASTLITAVVMAFTRAPRLAGVLLSVLPVGAFLFTIVARLADKVSARALDIEGKASTFLEQIVSSVRIVQAYAANNFLLAKYDNYQRNLEKDSLKRAVIKAGENAVAYLVLNLVYSIAFWYGGIERVKYDLPVGNLFTCFWNWFNALYALANILPHISAVIDSNAAQARIQDEIQRRPSIDVRDANGLRLEKGYEAGIKVHNLTFSYPSRPTIKSLDNVSMDIRPGEVTALVGSSGSGKSTISSLLLRYYDPPSSASTGTDAEKHGYIEFGGHNLRTLNLKWLRSQISIVSQEPQLFTASIFENVAYGLTDTPWEYDPLSSEKNLEETRARVKEALEMACAWQFVSALTNGMDTVISGGRNGVLSGGQRQRIAAARAFIRRPRVLILDEGTSALDSETEAELMKSVHIQQQEYGMTTILIAHRLSTIQQADKIIVVGQGKVEEEGTYEELIAKQGAFHTLVMHQTMDTESEDALEEAKPGPYDNATAPSELVSTKTIEDDEDKTLGLSLEELENGSNSSKTIVPCAIRSFASILWQERSWISLGTLGSLCLGGSFPVSAYLIGQVIITLSIENDPHALETGANKWSMWFLILALLDVLVALCGSAFLEYAADRISRKLRLSSLRSILIQEIGFFEQQDQASGTITAAINNNVGSVTSIMGLTLSQLLVSTVNLLGTVIMGFILSWRLSVVGLCLVPVVLFCGLGSVTWMARHEEASSKPQEAASGWASEHVDAIKTVAALGREEAILAYYDKQAEINGLSYRSLWFGSLAFGLGLASVLFTSSIVVWWGSLQLIDGRLSLSHLYATFEAIIIAGVSASRLFTYLPDLARAGGALQSISRWETRKPKVSKLEPLAAPKQVQGDIALKDITLQYASRPNRALDGVSIDIRAGQTVAFCGPSGGGKSTILSVLNRFYDPSRGTITLDGTDIRAIPLDTYRSQIALVSQDAVLYDGTFRENIELGRAVSLEELEEACRSASILDFIRSLPQGFDTHVGFKGGQMSGGQRQRVCIARALLRKPRILLLDEATSALDAESERAVQQALDQASKGRTTVVVAHRLSTIRDADVIHVVEDGRIVETGTHVSLVKRRGRYYDLVRSQL